MRNVIQINGGEIRGHLTQPYKGAWTVTLTAIPNVEADMVCDSLR